MKKVGECYKQVTKDVDIVDGNTGIEELIKVVSRNQKSRSLYVIDGQGNFAGIISVVEILKILGAKYLNDDTITILSRVMARKASDIMRRPVSVDIDDGIEEALGKMVQNDLLELPVLKEGKIIGNIDCFEVLNNLDI